MGEVSATTIIDLTRRAIQFPFDPVERKKLFVQVFHRIVQRHAVCLQKGMHLHSHLKV
jgi:hypothetical protein